MNDAQCAQTLVRTGCSQHRNEKGSSLILLRRLGSLILVAAAVAVYFLLAPATAKIGSASDHSADIGQAQSNFSANNSSAQYIYGQIYAADVATKDELAIVSRQLDEQSVQQAQLASALSKSRTDRRIPAELVIGIALIGLVALTAETSSVRKRGRATMLDAGPSSIEATS